MTSMWINTAIALPIDVMDTRILSSSVHLFTWARRIKSAEAQGQTKKVADALSSIHQRRVTQGSAYLKRNSSMSDHTVPLPRMASLYVTHPAVSPSAPSPFALHRYIDAPSLVQQLGGGAGNYCGGNSSTGPYSISSRGAKPHALCRAFRPDLYDLPAASPLLVHAAAGGRNPGAVRCSIGRGNGDVRLSHKASMTRPFIH